MIIWFSQKKFINKNFIINICWYRLNFYSYIFGIIQFCFCRLQQEAPSIKDKFEWLLLTFVLSILTYYIIEKPFRLKNKKFNVKNIKIIPLSY